MQQHFRKYFVYRPPPPANTHTHQTLRLGSKGQNSTFSEHGHVAYQIKGYREVQHNATA